MSQGLRVSGSISYTVKVSGSISYTHKVSGSIMPTYSTCKLILFSGKSVWVRVDQISVASPKSSC